MVKRLVWDYDYIKYQIASVCEKRDIVVVHNKSGNEKIFNTRTEFWGHWKKKEGGWLGELNKTRLEKGREPFKPEDFTITDRQTPEPIAFMNQTVKNHIKGITTALGATSYYGYIGKGDSWRVERSTLVKYKGSRADTLKPVMLEDIEEYLLKRHDATVVRDLEADDQVIIDCTKNRELILVGVDKDYMGCEDINLFNPDKMEEPFFITGLGKLYLDDKGEVRGYGRKFFYYQLLAGDDSDCYWANSATSKKYGSKGAYNALVDIPHDKGCWKAIVEIYKWLYPEAQQFTGWRGDTFTIDWLYVLRENVDMAYMRRTPTDSYNLEAALESIGETI